MAGLQVIGSFFTIRYELFESYSGSREAAEYIRTNDLQDEEIYATNYYCVAILPYFEQNIFTNFNAGGTRAFWWWSTENPLVQDRLWGEGNLPKVIAQIRQDKPRTVVLGVRQPYEKGVLPLDGYEVVAEYEGRMYWKFSPFTQNTFIILRRNTAGSACGSGGGSHNR